MQAYPRYWGLTCGAGNVVVSRRPSVYKWASVFRKLIGELIRDHKHDIV